MQAQPCQTARNVTPACKAIHTHSMEQDRAAIALWIDRLQHHSGQPVRLIGHGRGCLIGNGTAT